MPRPNKIWFRKDIGWWMVTIAGKKIRLTAGRKNRAEAEQKFHELMLTRQRSPTGPGARVVDVVEAFLAYSQKRFAADTYRNYRFYGQKFAESCGQLPVSELRPFHVTKWIDHQRWNATTEYNARRIARRALNWAVSEGFITENPLKGMPCPKSQARKRSLTDNEFRQLIGASHGPLRILLWSLRQTGARPAELRRLTWDEVHNDRLVIQHHKTAKKVHRPRVIYLTPAMQRLLHKLRNQQTSQYVFLNARRVPWTSNALRLAVHRIKDKCSLPEDVCAYLIRHTFGTQAIMNGLNTSVVAELMGHTSTEMVDRVYVHLADQVTHLQQAVCKATQKPANIK